MGARPQDNEQRSLYKWCACLYEHIGNVDGTPFPEGTYPLTSDDEERLYQKINRMLYGPPVPHYYFPAPGPMDPGISPGDPLFIYAQLPENPPINGTSYELDVADGPSLSWTFPYYPAFPPNTAVLPTAIPVIGIFLQRSTSSSAVPNLSSNFYEVSRDLPAVDSHWTTIKTWGPYAHFSDAYVDLLVDPDADNQTFTKPYSDSAAWPPSEGAYAYRLIMIMGPSAGKRYQLDWNVAMIIKPQTLTVSRPDGATATTLSWTPPDVSWWL